MKKYFVKVYMRILNFKNNILPRYFISSPFLSSFYYLFFSAKFRREQHAVLQGKVFHLKELKFNKSNVYTLIRNTHRIEKGLLMRPRRPVFALDFISETVDAFINIWEPKRMENDLQYKWFYDVLSEYFDTSGENKLVERERVRFLRKVDNTIIGQIEKKSIPYSRIDVDIPKISYDEFYKLTRYRRSVRWFLNEKVPRELVDKAILAANQSPTACNRQPFEYRVIDDPTLLKKVANLPRGVKGYVDGIPMMVVVVGNLDAYFDERDRHLIYIDASLANMTFMLALETLNLGSCPINWPDIEELEVKMDRVLELEKHQRAIMCMAVGFPDPSGKVAFSEKKNLNTIRKFN
ncbi:nitroreductase family protein [Cyclobacterium roseum]|uniref:nitroreductase family protein n=1 Tax=Cyclobacterium roseum TaxID=2666137 RepID=UPI001391DB94|nr:nitroreductase family protein [Cyclobacterium roseum]